MYEIIDPEGNSLGFANEYEFTQLRIDIAKAKATGYKVKTDTELLEINPNGDLPSWGKPQIFNKLNKLVADLVSLKSQNELENA